LWLYSIIALLIALLLPALSAARTQALPVRCGSNLRQLGVAMNACAADHRNALPYSVKGDMPNHLQAPWSPRSPRPASASHPAADRGRRAWLHEPVDQPDKKDHSCSDS